MHTVQRITLLVFFMISLVGAAAYGAGPDIQLTYSKKLTEPLTTSKIPTQVPIKFSLYDAEVDGNKYWDETKLITVTRSTAEINANLGDSVNSPLDAGLFNNQLWLQVEANGAIIGSRDKLLIAPYAIWSAISNVPGVPGAQGPQGVAGPQGEPGASGYNSLIFTTVEAYGANCASGGTKIQVGLDLNRNGTLDAGEVTQTKYMCNGTVTTQAPITVTATPSTPIARYFAEVTAKVALKNADGSPVSGRVSFTSSGTCSFYNSQSEVIDGTAAVAITNDNWSGGPCTVIADFLDNNTNTHYSGSTVVAFLPFTPTIEVTVTAAPSTQTINSFTNVSATARDLYSPRQPYDGTIVKFTSSGACTIDHAEQPTIAGIASVAVTSASAGPCIVYADFSNFSGSFKSGGSTLITFVP